MMEFSPGSVTLVGAGPGDPELVTVGGMRALRAADVVLYDRLVPKECLKECRPDAELVDVGKKPRAEFTPQEVTNQKLVEYAKQGKIVVRFKGGDPFVFGRGGEEWQACVQAGVPVQVIPGISSALAGPALMDIPITHRGITQGFTVVSGHVPPGDERSQLDWDHLAKTNNTLVLVMAVKNLPDIADALIAGGMDPKMPAATVQNASIANMMSIHAPLDEIAAAAEQAGIKPPAVTVIGQVAAEGLLNGNC